MRRDGFTLVEMLAAMSVFMIGFVAVYGLFLTAVRYRREAEDHMRSAVAASSLIADWRLRGEQPDASATFRHLPEQPGLFYRIQPGPAGLQYLQMVSLSAAIDEADEATVLRLRQRSASIEDLLERQVILEYPFVIR